MTTTDTTPSIEARIARLLVGAIDPHVHSGPSIAPRGLDHLALVRETSEAGFAAVITKDHDYAGVATAALITANFPELKTRIYSGIALNNVVGGLNPWAVEHTAAMGGKVVFMPTLAAEHHLRWEKKSSWVHPATTQKVRPAVGVPVLDADGAVRDDTKEILDIVARTGLVLVSGHLHVSETWKVFEEAKRRGVATMVLTHPEDIVEATLDDVRGLVALGAYVEHSLCMFLEGSKFKTRTAEDLKAQIDAAGVDRTILCSDLGQTGVYSPLEGFRRGIRLCMDLGYADADIRKMVSTNAARAFRLEADLPDAATRSAA
ncbi:DUF6282 family protein [Rhodoplanes sp. TEM]|uniref:DUF6282 family protein n=1 Tax=Rhodoplanes tepidamans TaxID=200616 RepID=A0ABT5J528_RHOTP|nr:MULTISPECIES: DUF6282 family protein [Rhodoplanes]MDC7784688.1 DUF6282 family protein [Rhodoplanes tepidamans]MDC7982155.1 DUF6282 family protein [Rhodoplanes sp. TEM]MDQ0356159.1 hypothetical protein [Rhodoplanes tepidamans]